jgi:hypothetical protein
VRLATVARLEVNHRFRPILAVDELKNDTSASVDMFNMAPTVIGWRRLHRARRQRRNLAS